MTPEATPMAATTLDPPVPYAAPRALTRRATANALASLLDYAARIGMGLVVTPVLVRGLGPALFGSWEMLLRLGSYVSSTDGRPSEALRLLVAQARAGGDARGHRRLVGASLVVWCLMLPVVAFLGAALVYAAPALTGAGPANVDAVRIAAACLVGTMLVGSLGSIPESVLRGMNRGHTRMGVQAALHVVGGALAAGAVWTGLGLAGLGGALLLRALLTGLCFWWLVSRGVPWFGAARPARGEVRRVFGMSAWLMAGDLIAKLVLASDVLILGALLAPTAVTTYVLTGYAARVAVGVHGFTAGEAVPGIGALLGHAEYARVRAARRELLLLTWAFVTLSGAAVLLWNRAFVAHWVGTEMYAGPLVDLLIVLSAAQTAFIRVDSGIIDAALAPRARVLVGIAAAALTLTLGILGTALWGMAGLAAAIIVGRGVQSVGYPLIARRALGAHDEREHAPTLRRDARRDLMRAVLASVVVLGAALALSRVLRVSGWATFAVGVGASLVPIAALTLTIGCTAHGRAALWRRVRLVRGGGAA